MITKGNDMRCGKMFSFLSVLLFGLGFAGGASAESMNGRYQVKALFSEAGAAGVYLKEGLPQCRFDLMYISLATSEGKAILALLMSAKMAGMAVTRIDYVRDASTTMCTMTAVHVE